MIDPERPLRVVIVDDEEPGRLALRQDLTTIEGIEILAECENGFEAVKAITDARPDLVILDVQMPKLTGFEVLELVGPGLPVIFVTAYDQFALKAFEVHAVDYLLKPFTRDRLAAAIERVRASTALSPGASTALSPGASTALSPGASTPLGVSPSALRASARRPGDPLDRIVIRDGSQVHVVPIEKVDYIEAQDDYVAVRTGGRSLLKEQTLGDIEQQLDARRFVRIHRSYLLNIDRLARVELYAKDSRIAILTDGAKLPVSRSGYQRLKELL